MASITFGSPTRVHRLGAAFLQRRIIQKGIGTRVQNLGSER